MKLSSKKMFTFASLVMVSSLILTTALAGPPTKKGGKKPPTKKGPAKKADPMAAAIAAGKKVYEKFGCANCHAIAGKGGMAAPDLTKVGANAKHDDKWMTESIVNPKADDPDSSMPSYEETIKGDDLKNIVAYMRSLK